ncbi:hypothetical protein CcarbDRAFT_0701 [Clostridium carboxidivorans P7]|uniref:Uncharacterized protein n=1 Tax=Clostridium carboxidivorans P7 TaxID=536227 RepID=C6PPI4_9CLOT|nr:hypothetical protein [Clostridium carboxidivorans]EET88878.1 hypothetical protein CcarbDRAFT_0701 [Clostridium carboxidivorans P7]
MSGIKVNGIDIENDYNKYITDNLNIIDIIEIVLKTPKEIIDDYLKSTVIYLERMLPKLELLVDDIYLGFSKDLWGKFADFFEGLESITRILEMLCDNKKLYHGIDNCIIIKKKLSEEIKNLSEAFKIEDRVYISDLIIYEIKVTLESLYKEINIILNKCNYII